MIIELILLPIQFLVTFILEQINVSDFTAPLWLTDTLNLLAKALMFFPSEVYLITMANIAFWITVQFTWAIIEWIYKKIPGVN